MNNVFRLYEYEIKKELNCIYFFSENQMKDKIYAYVLAHLIYFDFEVRADGFYIYSKYVMLDDTTDQINKYNYTVHKNLLNTGSSNPPFKEKWIKLKTESDGDGDKPLAALLCKLKYDKEINIDGWIINELLHFMICSPKDFLDLKNIYLQISHVNVRPDYIEVVTNFLKEKLNLIHVKDELGIFYIEINKTKFSDFNIEINKIDFDELKKKLYKKILATRLKIQSPDTDTIPLLVTDTVDKKIELVVSESNIKKIDEKEVKLSVISGTLSVTGSVAEDINNDITKVQEYIKKDNYIVTDYQYKMKYLKYKMKYLALLKNIR